MLAGRTLFAPLRIHTRSILSAMVVIPAVAVPKRTFFQSPMRKNLISGALDEVLAEEDEEGDEDMEGEEILSESTQEFAKAKRKNAKGSQWRYDRVISNIKGKSLNDAFEILKQVRMHRKAQVVHKLLWAARSAAEHNYSLDPEILYVDEIYATKGVHLTGRAIFHGRGRTGRKSRPRTHLFVTLKEMPETMLNRVRAWEEREVLWRDHMLAKTQQFGDLFPDVQFVLPQTTADQVPHNAGKTIKSHEHLPFQDKEIEEVNTLQAKEE